MIGMASHDDGELNRIVGEISGKLDGLQRDNVRLFKENRVLFHGVDDIRGRISKVEDKVAPLPEVVAEHTASIQTLKAFDKNLTGIFVFIGLAASSRGAGA